MKVCIVIPNWNGEDYIRPCLESLLAQSHQAEIVVVDNGSVDDSLQIIKNDYANVKLIELPKNTGFTGGVNTGIKYALQHGFDYVALFNNDAVADKAWLGELVRSLKQRPEAGISTGKFMRMDKEHLDTTGDCYSAWGMPFPRGRNQKDNGQFDQADLVFGATGGASLYSAKMLKEIGPFDEHFFAYFEDVDISFRAQLAGWKVVYTPAAIAYHHVGATSSKLGSFSRYHSIKNFFMLYTKNMPGVLYWKYLPLFLIQALRLGVSSTLRGGLIPYLKGLGRFLLNLPAVLKQRSNIQKKRQVSIAYVDSLLYKKRPPKTPLI